MEKRAVVSVGGCKNVKLCPLVSWVDGRGKRISGVSMSTRLFTILCNITNFSSFLLSVKFLSPSLFNISVSSY